LIHLSSVEKGWPWAATASHRQGERGERERERKDGPTIMDARGSSWNTSVVSGTQNDTDAIATKTLGRLISMERRWARGLIRMVVPASKLSKRER
jgi:hypothetical protein